MNGSMAVSLGRLQLKNPIMSAAGTFSVESAQQFFDVNTLGAVVAKTITLLPRSGNETPRVAETYGGMLNSVGLENPGLDKFLAEEMPKLAALSAPVIVSVAGHSVEEFREMARRLDAVTGISAIEVNVSCPNVACGGKVFAADAGQITEVISKMRAVTNKYLIAKLSPNVGDIVEMALAAETAGADALCVANTLLGMKIDTRTRRPVLANVVGGLSGPAVKPVILRMVYQIYSQVSIPIIGVGGISTLEDVLEYLLAGASAVQVGTASFVNPAIMPELIAELAAYMKERQLVSMSELIGAAQR